MTRHMHIPIGSMVLAYMLTLGGIVMVHVTVYIAYMDPMGYESCSFGRWAIHYKRLWPKNKKTVAHITSNMKNMNEHSTNPSKVAEHQRTWIDHQK